MSDKEENINKPDSIFKTLLKSFFLWTLFLGIYLIIVSNFNLSYGDTSYIRNNYIKFLAIIIIIMFWRRHKKIKDLSINNNPQEQHETKSRSFDLNRVSLTPEKIVDINILQYSRAIKETTEEDEDDALTAYKILLEEESITENIDIKLFITIYVLSVREYNVINNKFKNLNSYIMIFFSLVGFSSISSNNYPSFYYSIPLLFLFLSYKLYENDNQQKEFKPILWDKIYSVNGAASQINNKENPEGFGFSEKKETIEESPFKEFNLNDFDTPPED